MIIPLNLQENSYDIVLERGVLARAGGELNLDRRVLIVTDDGVPEEYAGCILSQCKEGYIFTLPRGEATKSIGSFEAILSAMLEHGFTRKDCVVAVGGGVTGDLSGFAAACYMRGVDFYNIPTTLLSQVDSSIGGKTAVDLNGVKNIVGAFYQPKKVLIDPDTLKTLDSRQVSAGLAEAIKMAATSDGALFELIKNSTDLEEDLTEIIKGALLIKRGVVEKDPKEQGLRKILNFGHTIGHAVESFEEGALLHGECVAAGMLPMCSSEAAAELLPVLEKYDLPVTLKNNAHISKEPSEDELMALLLHDKKMQTGSISVIFVEKIGSCRIEDVDPASLRDRIKKIL